MKNPQRIFIIFFLLLVFLASLAWIGIRQIAQILHEFDQVAHVDLALMEGATTLNDLQLKKELIFAKLSSTSEELAFGQVSAARGQYLADYVKGLGEEFDHIIELTDQQMRRIDQLPAVPEALKDSFEKMHQQTKDYDSTISDIFKAVEKGGFQLSLDDLDRTDSQQKILTENVQNIVSKVWEMVHESTDQSQRWHRQTKLIFWFSLLLMLILALLLIIFKENLDEISRQKKDLEKLNLELDRFVHTISHDIAGPLTTIVGYAAFLEKKYSPILDDQGKNCINGVRKGATRMNLLIKDMLELTRMTRVKNPFTKVFIQELVDASMANCDFLIRQSQAQIIIEKKLPEIVCDRIKMTAVFFNLISNAIKFAKPEIPPVIKINWDETPEYYTFYIKDNGIGIDPKHHEEIFEIFKRLHPLDQHDGSGVGLTIVKAAVEDQGGKIRLESTVDQGTSFIFTVPKNLIPVLPLY